MASISPNSCPCGRTFRLLSELEGRVEDILPLVDGRFVHPRAVWQVFKDNRDVLQYQLTQRELQRFEFTLAMVDKPSFRGALAGSLPELASLLGPGAIIAASRRIGPVRAAGGKFRAVASQCGKPHEPARGR